MGPSGLKAVFPVFAHEQTQITREYLKFASDLSEGVCSKFI